MSVHSPRPSGESAGPPGTSAVRRWARWDPVVILAGRRRKIAVDDWLGWGIDAALRMALAPPATPPPGLAGPASV